jgi:hypothetical protein
MTGFADIVQMAVQHDGEAPHEQGRLGHIS